MPELTPARRACRFAAVPVLGAALLAQVAPPAPASIPPTATAPAAEAWTVEWDHWYTLDLGGVPAGWMHEMLRTDGARFRSDSTVNLRISRAGMDIEIEMEERFLETKDGAPIEIRFRQDMARQVIDTTWTFEPDGVRAVSRQGGRAVETTLPLPEGTWLTPAAADRYWRERRDAGATEITMRIVDGESGVEPVTVTNVLEGEEKVVVGERTIPVTVWKSTTSAMPGVHSIVKMSADGHRVEEIAELPFGRMTTRIATQAAVRARGAAPPPELMVTTFTRADRPIPRPRSTTRSTLRVRTIEGDPPVLPSAGAQRVEPDGDGRSLLLHIDVDDPLPATPEERADPVYRQASTMADSGDPLIVALARRATRGLGDDPRARAEALRVLVHDLISTKALDTGFATASETAKMRTGDCSEHGVLLCALLRADGIPARVATGLVYLDSFAGEKDIFGWHMWTQALVDGRWLDLDATLDERYDAAHVLTGTSALNEGEGPGDVAAILMLIGNLEIEVVSVEHR